MVNEVVHILIMSCKIIDVVLYAHSTLVRGIHRSIYPYPHFQVFLDQPSFCINVLVPDLRQLLSYCTITCCLLCHLKYGFFVAWNTISVTCSGIWANNTEYLRRYFISLKTVALASSWFYLGCNMLNMFIIIIMTMWYVTEISFLSSFKCIASFSTSVYVKITWILQDPLCGDFLGHRKTKRISSFSRSLFSIYGRIK